MDTIAFADSENAIICHAELVSASRFLEPLNAQERKPLNALSENRD